MWNIQSAPQVRETCEPISFTVTDFTERSLQSFEKALHKADMMEQPVFPIKIQSDGGRSDILFGMMSLMLKYREKGMQFAGVVAGTASSAGACIFMFCDFRYMGEFSSLLIHSSQIYISNNLPVVTSMVDFIKAEDDKMNDALEKHLKKKKGWIKAQMKKNGVDDWLISAQTALELGLATCISIPEFNLRISAEFSIT
jgi:ATP-dependent protease ClpP protease subunit